jgi:dUTP pyrophosphatase
MKIAIMREVTPPTRGTSKSAGFDLYVPKFTDTYIRVFNTYNPDAQSQCMIDPPNKNIIIRPNGRLYLPTGIKVEVPEGSALFVKNKGGASWEMRLTKIAEVVDEDYQGEIFITLNNYSAYPTILTEGKKFIQLVRLPVFYDEIEIVPEDQLHLIRTERGDGAMGSTGK